MQTERLLASNESSAAEMRRKLVELECRRRGLSSKDWPRIPATMLVSDRFRVMYCMVGKVASSTWKKVFLMAAGIIDPKYVLQSIYFTPNYVTPSQCMYVCVVKTRSGGTRSVTPTLPIMQ